MEREIKIYPSALIRNLYRVSEHAGSLRTALQAAVIDIKPWSNDKEAVLVNKAVMEMEFMVHSLEELDAVLFSVAQSLETGEDFHSTYAKFCPRPIKIDLEKIYD